MQKRWWLCLQLVACLSGCSAYDDAGAESGRTQLSISGKGLRALDRAVWIRAWDGASWVPTGSASTIEPDGSWRADRIDVSDAVFLGPCQAGRFRAEDESGQVVTVYVDSDCAAAAERGEAVDPACFGSEVVVQRVQTVESYVPPGGTLQIGSQEQADRYGCVESIDGNLEIDGGERANPSQPSLYELGLKVRMPALSRISGDLTIHGNHAERVALPALTRVTGDVTLRSNVFRYGPQGSDVQSTAIELPRLAEVGTKDEGELSLLVENLDDVDTGSGQWSYEFGLQALRAAHDVTVSTAGNPRPSKVVGLPALSRVTGSVLLDWPRWELIGNQVLQGLEAIDGNLTIRAGNHLIEALPRVSRIGGDFTLEGGDACSVNASLSTARVLPNLAQVTGNMTVSGCGGWRCDTRAFPALTRVDKTLAFRGVAWPAAAEIGAQAVNVGSLVIADSDSAGIFRHDVLSVSPGGSVQIANNPKLCQCTIDQFVSDLRGGGFRGSVTASGNGDCVPCPQPSRCESNPS